MLCARRAQAPATEARFVRQPAGQAPRRLAVRTKQGGQRCAAPAAEGAARFAGNRERLVEGAPGRIRVVAGVFGMSWPARRAVDQAGLEVWPDARGDGARLRLRSESAARQWSRHYGWVGKVNDRSAKQRQAAHAV